METTVIENTQDYTVKVVVDGNEYAYNWAKDAPDELTTESYLASIKHEAELLTQYKIDNGLFN